MSGKPNYLGALGSFYTPDEALQAAKSLKDSKYKLFDVLTPFPVHGMDEAMGLKRSWVPWFSALFAALGILAAQAMMIYIMVIDWPMNFGGKPFFAWPSFVPITFELMVLFSGILTAVFAILGGKKDTVPQPPSMLRTGATMDRFVLWISASDPAFDHEDALKFLQELDADDIRLIDQEGNYVA